MPHMDAHNTRADPAPAVGVLNTAHANKCLSLSNNSIIIE
jgi:hypothetical protein